MTDDQLQERQEAKQARIDRAAARVRGEAPQLVPPAKIVRSLATGRVQISRGAFS